MSKAKVIVLSVVVQGLTKAEAACRYDVSWQWVHTLVTRYQAGGLEALEPRSRRPLSNSRAAPEALRQRIVELRKQLEAEGLDAGPVTIAGYLAAEGHTAPSTSTIRRILHQAGLVVPAPKKRPPQLASPLHRRPAQRVLAVRLHPLAPGRRQRRGDHRLARRPLPAAAVPNRLPPRHRRQRR
jgi:transposase